MSYGRMNRNLISLDPIERLLCGDHPKKNTIQYILFQQLNMKADILKYGDVLLGTVLRIRFFINGHMTGEMHKDTLIQSAPKLNLGREMVFQ
jgi:hypothetical protein